MGNILLMPSKEFMRIYLNGENFHEKNIDTSNVMKETVKKLMCIPSKSLNHILKSS